MQTIKAVVEKISEETITLLIGEEEREMIIERNPDLFPKDLKAGEWLELELEEDAILSVRVDKTETDQVKKRIQEKMELLRRRTRDDEEKQRSEEHTSE